MKRLPSVIFEIIKSRRTIRKYKSQIPPKESINRILDVPYFILKDFPIPFQLVVIQEEARNKAVNIINQTYSVARDLAVLYNMVPDDLKEWYKNFMKEFVRTLGNAPIIIIGLTDLKNNAEYNFKISWIIAQAIMIQAKSEGLDTGSITFSSKTVEEELIRDFLKMDINRWSIAFVLNCGYRDEEPIVKEIKGGIYEIY
ncbi:MAG: nitroreductase family protein [Candidatus Hydrothermia bacterium]|jgi:nitroreductase|nr:nitroreductase family protein [Candidatus Hydrothermia bacterium]